MRGQSWLLVLGTFVCLAAGCNEETLERLVGRSSSPGSNPSAPARPPAPPSVAPAVSKNGDAVAIATFNIQVFGTSKLEDTQVMDVLAMVVRRFDVVAIQEVRAKDQTVLERFVALINAGGERYDYVVGPRLGRTSSKEQYAFVFDTARIELDRDSVYTVPDPQDRLHREPLVARFRVRGPPSERAHTFTLVNIHTDPDETSEELDALGDVFAAVQQHVAAYDDDVILLGDLNVDEHHLGKLGRLPDMAWAVSGTTTNTRRTKSYDNIVFNRQATTEYTGRWGVLDLMAEYDLTEADALRVSDHLPVWAEFGTHEAAAGRLAGGKPEATR
jgi:endonuclease/exonuclease/phosphatase family metal-dependent hydrolase